MTEGDVFDESSSEGPTDSEQTDTELSDCDEETMRLMLLQQQLILLLHALDCHIKDEKKRITGFEPYECANYPYCTTLKAVLVHMGSCTLGEACRVKHCHASKMIIAHWNRCLDLNNILCRCCGFIIKGLNKSIDKDLREGRRIRQLDEISL